MGAPSLIPKTLFNRTPNADVIVTPDAYFAGSPALSGAVPRRHHRLTNRVDRRGSVSWPGGKPTRTAGAPGAEERKRRGSTKSPARAAGHITYAQSRECADRAATVTTTPGSDRR